MTTVIDHLPGRTLSLEGVSHLFFSGTAYFGMGHQPAFHAALCDGMGRYGTIFSASRNNNLQLKIYDEAEFLLAQITGAEAALTVTSGLLAGQLLIQSLRNQSFIYAPGVHPAIWHTTTPPQYFYENFADFSQKIASQLAEASKDVTVCCNALDPLRCESYDFNWLNYLPNNKRITLVFDDSHGIGITTSADDHAQTGIGGGFFRILKDKYADIFNKENVEVVVIASLAKALGIPGGVILGNKTRIAALRSVPLFVGASPIVPAYLYAFLHSQAVYTHARTRLKENISFFKEKMKRTCVVFESAGGQAATQNQALSFKTLPNFPVFFTECAALSDFLKAEKIIISHFSYPKPTDPPISRVILSSLHTKEDIEILSQKIHLFCEKTAIDKEFC